ncbi:hypothetical protein [Hyphobacterium marinum]|uniref:Uncharacterized protein n=1 Tax=Hyphobacterium marinum TaxID=3116574 RepID=A0ABU7LX08_9PROT|nr:hypothetical protein [Hyphobacterium sp. Y6023]MEE2566099.1 hypothetical protein [Hyphobacterium sp. Y6023]
MKLFSKLTAAAALAAVGMTALPAMAEAQYGQRGGAYGYDRERNYDNRRGGWNGPEGYFTVRRDLCPDLIEDRRDRRFNRGRADRREDRRDRQVLNCPARAWDYVPSRREARMGRHGDRLRPTRAYLDRRTGTYLAETRWGAVPVQIIGGRHYRPYRGHRNGVSFSIRLN